MINSLVRDLFIELFMFQYVNKNKHFSELVKEGLPECALQCVHIGRWLGEVRRGHLRKAEILRISDSCSV